MFPFCFILLTLELESTFLRQLLFLLLFGAAVTKCVEWLKARLGQKFLTLLLPLFELRSILSSFLFLLLLLLCLDGEDALLLELLLPLILLIEGGRDLLFVAVCAVLQEVGCILEHVGESVIVVDIRNAFAAQVIEKETVSLGQAARDQLVLGTLVVSFIVGRDVLLYILLLLVLKQFLLQNSLLVHDHLPLDHTLGRLGFIVFALG